jgi:hypothetical protein
MRCVGFLGPGVSPDRVGWRAERVEFGFSSVALMTPAPASAGGEINATGGMMTIVGAATEAIMRVNGATPVTAGHIFEIVGTTTFASLSEMGRTLR